MVRVVFANTYTLGPIVDVDIADDNDLQKMAELLVKFKVNSISDLGRLVAQKVLQNLNNIDIDNDVDITVFVNHNSVKIEFCKVIDLNEFEQQNSEQRELTEEEIKLVNAQFQKLKEKRKDFLYVFINEVEKQISKAFFDEYIEAKKEFLRIVKDARKYAKKSKQYFDKKLSKYLP